jgi:DNA-binding MarR family transcriptional regulator
LPSKEIAERDYDFWILLTRVYHIMAKLRKLESSRYSILPVQAYLLFMIKALGNETTPTELVKYVYQQPSAISDILNRMEKLNLITKSKRSNEGRLVIIKMTEKGEKALELSSHREFLHKVLASLSKKEMDDIEVGLAKLHDSGVKELNILQKKLVRPSQISNYYLDNNRKKVF